MIDLMKGILTAIVAVVIIRLGGEVLFQAVGL